MSNSNYKSTDALMRHLRNNGIAISGSSQKQQLINTGYFHGYKGYRFFVSSNRRIPFTLYNEINATIQYDTKLKSLLYGKMMLIERQRLIQTAFMICMTKPSAVTKTLQQELRKTLRKNSRTINLNYSWISIRPNNCTMS